MKTLKLFLLTALMITFLNSTINSQPTYKPKKSAFPQWSISGIGGIAFPVGNFGENFKSGPTFGLDLSYKVNKEVGFYIKGGYSIFPDKTQGAAPDGKFIEYTIGPRYYFTAKNLKSSIFLEAGLGGYSFIQDEYQLNGVEVPKYTSTNFGVNGGIGGILNLGRDVDLLFKAKYHNVLTTDGSTSFIEPVLGVDIRF